MVSIQTSNKKKNIFRNLLQFIFFIVDTFIIKYYLPNRFVLKAIGIKYLDKYWIGSKFDGDYKFCEKKNIKSTCFCGQTQFFLLVHLC